MSDTATFCATCGARVLTEPAPTAEAPPAATVADSAPLDADEDRVPRRADDDWLPSDAYHDQEPLEHQSAPAPEAPGVSATPSPGLAAMSDSTVHFAIAATAVLLSSILTGVSLSSLPNDVFMTAWWLATLFVVMRMFGVRVTTVRLLWIAATCNVVGFVFRLVFGPMLGFILGSTGGHSILLLVYIGLFVGLFVEAVIITLFTDATLPQALLIVIVAWLGSASIIRLLMAMGIYL
jgi:hypothetical protein